MTIIDLSINKNKICCKGCPLEVVDLVKQADHLQTVGFQEIIGHKERTAIFSIGGYWRGNKFILESIGGKWYGNKLQYSKINGLKIILN